MRSSERHRSELSRGDIRFLEDWPGLLPSKAPHEAVQVLGEKSARTKVRHKDALEPQSDQKPSKILEELAILLIVVETQSNLAK